MNLKTSTIYLLLLVVLVNITVCEPEFLGKNTADEKDSVDKISERMLEEESNSAGSTDVGPTNTDPGNSNCRLVEVCEMVYFPRIGYKEVCRNEYRCE